MDLRIRTVFLSIFLCTFVLCAPASAQRVEEGVVVLYAFDAGDGTVIEDLGPGDPLDLEIDEFDLDNFVEWLPDGGLALNLGTGPFPEGGALPIQSLGPATKVYDAIAAPDTGTNALTIEAWIVPEIPDLQSNISRLVTMSVDTTNRNFTLGTSQLGTEYVNRLRTPVTGFNGVEGPNHLVDALASVRAGELQHVVFTRDAQGVETLYVDGEVVAGPRTVSGADLPPPVGSLAAAEALIGGDAPFEESTVESEPLVRADYGTNGEAHFHLTRRPPGLPLAGDVDDYAIEITGTLNVLVPGTYTFVYSGDDGGKIEIDFNDGAGLTGVIPANDTHAVQDWGGVVEFPAAGTYAFRLVGFERGGGDTFEWMYAEGDRTLDFANGQLNVPQAGGTAIGTNLDGTTGPWFLIGVPLVSAADPAQNLIEVVEGAAVDVYKALSSGDTAALSNWDPFYPLAIGNELTGGRKFNGEYHLLAIYDRALTLEEIEENLDAGPTVEGPGGMGGLFRRGDVDGSGALEVGDPVRNLAFQFLGEAGVPCLDALDWDDSGTIEVTDPIGNLSHQFLGAPPAPAPGTTVCGGDPTEDELDCTAYPEENC